MYDDVNDNDKEDAPRSGSAVEVDEDKMKAFVYANRRIITRKIAESKTIHDHV